MPLGWPRFGNDGALCKQQTAESGLSFVITNDYPSKNSRLAQDGFRLIGKRGRRNIYSINAKGFDGSAAAIARLVKPRLIAALAANVHSGAEPLISTARSLATQLLNQYHCVSSELVAYVLAHETAGYGPISMLLEDAQNIEEIIIDTPHSNIRLYHTMYGYCTTNLRFRDERALRYMINKLIHATEKEFDGHIPIMDVQLSVGSPAHAQPRPYTGSRTTASIHLNPNSKVDLAKLIQNNTASAEALAYLWLAIDSKFNVIITGVPRGVRCSLLNALGVLLPSYERVIAIGEEVGELDFPGSMLSSMELQRPLKWSISTRDRLSDALRIRPDRLIIGALHDTEVNNLFTGANRGIPFVTAMHITANGHALVNRLASKPMCVEPQLLCMLDASVLLSYNGINPRRIENIAEYRWLARDELRTDGNKIEELAITMPITSDGADVELLKCSKLILCYSRLHLISVSAALREFEKRTEFLRSITRQKACTKEYIRSYMEIK